MARRGGATHARSVVPGRSSAGHADTHGFRTQGVAGRRYDPGVPFDPVAASLDLVTLEHRVQTRWDTDDVFGESLRRRAGAPEWVFYEGPPTANGRPGIHHVWARLFKDIYPRFHTMRGRHVARKGGWDCHGLPVEVEVEKELGIHNKHEIEAFGIGEFNRLCRESVHRYVSDFEALTKRIGMWLDTDDAYWTLDNSYIESVWWLLRQMWDAGNIYEGHKVVPYCGRCGTALSSHELGQPGAYRDITEPSVYVRFPLVERDFDLLVWTTTPWTLVSNVGAAVGPDVEYVRVRGRDGRRDLVMAAGARRRRARRRRRGRRRRSRSADLVGLHYERPFDLLPLDRTPCDGARVVAADFVTVDDGSGIVHLAPAFGEIDREIADAEGLPMLNPVGPAAAFVDTPTGSTPWTGTFVKDADPAIIDALAASGALERVVDSTHSYPHCWRCGTPLIYWAKPTWFARTSAHKADLLRENEDIGWHPEHIKHGRFGDWLENNVDWALSRDRFWGTPFPVWRCDDCGTDTCIGSVAELAERSRARPHRPRPPPSRGRRRHHRVPEVRTARHAPRRAGARRVVRLRRDAHRAVPLPVRARGPVRATVPCRLHLRGDRPDARLVLLAARGQHARVRPQSLPQRRLPGPGRRQGRPEDVEDEGQRHRPVDGARHARCRRVALELLLRRLTVDPAPRVGRGDRRVGALPGDAVEHLLVLRHLREPRRLGARRGAGCVRRRTCSTGGSGHGCTAPSPRSPTRSTRSTRCAARRRSSASSTTSPTGTCAVRGRASGRRTTRPRTRPCTSACRPSRSCSHRSPRSWPTSCTATCRAPTNRCTWPTGRSPTTRRATRPSKRRWSGRARSCRSGCRPATRPSSRCANRSGGRWCSSPTAPPSPTRSPPRSPTPST